MEVRRQDIDALAFAVALAALSAAAVGFGAARNGAAVVMCALCLAGIVGGRLVGVSGVALLLVAVGLDALLWMVWIAPPADSHVTSAIAHAGGGLLAGFALAETLRRRVSWPAWALLAIVAVFALTVAWELGEFLGDRALTTALIPSRRDSAVDIILGTGGGVAAVAATWLFAGARPTRR